MKKNASVKHLWLVRHGEAEDLASRGGSDLERALTTKGRRVSKRVFERLASVRSVPDVVISSQAFRAKQTAELLVEAFGCDGYEHTTALNPGCRFAALRKVVEQAWKNADVVALVGHEPDFSRAASRWIGAHKNALVLAKSGVIQLELNTDKTVRLVMVLSPAVFS